MKKMIYIFAMASLIGCNSEVKKEENTSADKNNEEMKTSSFYDFSFTSIDGEEFDFADLKGKRVLVVNTASKCGFTPQYEELQKLYETYGGTNFEIVAFPSNNFGGQEPLENEEIKSFCQKNFGVTFPIMEKSDVAGANQNVVFEWLTQASLNGHEDAEVEWNFQKFLIDENGEWFRSLPSNHSPLEADVLDFAKM